MGPKRNSQLTAGTSKAQAKKGKAKLLRDETSSEDNSSDEDYVQEGTESRGSQGPKNKRRRNSQTTVLQKFLNGEAQNKFCEFAIRHIHIERAFAITQKPYIDTIAFYNWQGLTTAPDICNVAIAKEYYANAAGAELEEVNTKGVYLRGKYLKLTSKAINDHYGLTSYENDDLCELCEVGNPDTAFRMLSLPGMDWVRNDRGEIRLARLRDLTAEAKTWLLFINSRLMPTSQNSKISVVKLFLVYAIKNKLTVDVGKFFIAYINHAMTEESQAMYFPLFLTEQAIKLGVKVSGECQPPIGPIKDGQLSLYQSTEATDRRQRQQEEEARARERIELAQPMDDIEGDEAPQEQDQHINNQQPAHGVHDFRNMK